MDLLEEIRRHLPSYLSPSKQEKLFRELDKFPDNIDQRMYAPQNISDDTIRQGDGMDNMPMIFLPDEEINKERALIISNTCDISPQNERRNPPSIVYCPVIKYDSYSRLVEDSYDSQDAAENFLRSVRNQKKTSRFYLPSGYDIPESIVLLDKANNCSARYAYDSLSINNDRAFSLSLYGFYLLIFKLSVHFTRFNEGISRSI